MQNIIRQFIDFEGPADVIAFGHGHINDTFRVIVEVEGATKSYLLQRINHLIFKQPERVMQNIHSVASHLVLQPYPLVIPFPLLTHDGSLLYQENNDHWRLFNFIQNTLAFEAVQNVDHAYEAAKAFGGFAKALNYMDASQLYTTIPGFHEGLARLAQFKATLHTAPSERLKNAGNEIKGILDHQDLFANIAKAKFPPRVVHHDAKINNLLFDEKTLKPVAVVDWDTIMPGIVLSDFGDMVRTFTCAVSEDETDLAIVEMRRPYFEAVTEGFLFEMGGLLTPLEREYLAEGGRWITLMQAMRFLGDYLKGDVYYKTTYPGQNLMRARNQLKLFQSMC